MSVRYGLLGFLGSMYGFCGNGFPLVVLRIRTG